MRVLFLLMIFAGFIWLICYSFYSLGRKDATRGQKQRDDASETRRKKVESFVIENENNSNSSKDKK